MAETSVRFRDNYRLRKCDLSPPNIVHVDVGDESPDDAFSFFSADNLRSGISLGDCNNRCENGKDKNSHPHITSPFRNRRNPLCEQNEKTDDNLELVPNIDVQDCSKSVSWISDDFLVNSSKVISDKVGEMKIIDNSTFLAADVQDFFTFDSDSIIDDSENKYKFHLTDNVSDLKKSFDNTDLQQVTNDFSDLLSTITLQDNDNPVSQKLSSFSDSANFSFEHFQISDLNEIQYKVSESNPVSDIKASAFKDNENLSDWLSSIKFGEDTSIPNSSSESYYSDSSISPDESKVKSSPEESYFPSSDSGFSTASSFSDDGLQNHADNKIPHNLDSGLHNLISDFSFFNTSDKSNSSIGQLLDNAKSKKLAVTNFENQKSDDSEKDITMLDLLKAVNFEQNASYYSSDESRENSLSSCDLTSIPPDDTTNNIDLSTCIKTADSMSFPKLETVDRGEDVTDMMFAKTETFDIDLSVCVNVPFNDADSTFLQSSTLHTACPNAPRTNSRPSLFAKALSYKRKRETPSKSVSDIKSELCRKYTKLLTFAETSPNSPKTNIVFSNSCVLHFTGRRVHGSDNPCAFS